MTEEKAAWLKLRASYELNRKKEGIERRTADLRTRLEKKIASKVAAFDVLQKKVQLKKEDIDKRQINLLRKADKKVANFSRRIDKKIAGAPAVTTG